MTNPKADPEAATGANEPPITLLEKRRAQLDAMAFSDADTEKKRQDMNEFYDQWTEGYDEDMISEGYVGHINLAKEVSEKFSDKSSRLLDCASGTGLLGGELKKLGFTNLAALDSSQGSLDFSRSKNVYSDYICATLGSDRLPIDDDSYDGVCLTAALSAGHVGLQCIPEWIRITKSGGLVMFVIREDMLLHGTGFCNGAVDAMLHSKAETGGWQLLEKKFTLYMDGEVTKEKAYIYILKVL